MQCKAARINLKEAERSSISSLLNLLRWSKELASSFCQLSCVLHVLLDLVPVPLRPVIIYHPEATINRSSTWSSCSSAPAAHASASSRPRRAAAAWASAARKKEATNCKGQCSGWSGLALLPFQLNLTLHACMLVEPAVFSSVVPSLGLQTSYYLYTACMHVFGIWDLWITECRVFVCWDCMH